MFLMNRKWLHVLILNIIVRKIVNSIIVKDIKNKQHFNFDYVVFDFYIENKINDKFVIARLKRDVHIMNDFKTKMLIDINIICFKKMIVDLQKQQLIIKSCNFITLIKCTSTEFKINKTIKSHYIMILSTYFIMSISFKNQKSLLFNKKNYSFQSHATLLNFNVEKKVMIHIMNSETSAIHIRNAIDKLIIIFKHIKLNKITNYEKKNCYHINVFNVYLTTKIN